MARKHNTKHFRTGGGYRRRLAKAGLSHAPRMRWSEIDDPAKMAEALKAAAEKAKREGKRL